ncbi:prolyl oligopeptidase family serine peptidase [Burkholderiaceae bacterium DAT-1]|nr:prolyl oligopeptidase family serine peptidase [Burkholderiaceae bacterium DAT-1]
MRTTLAISLLALGIGQAFAQASEPARDTAEDAFQWLEEVNGEKPMDWVKGQNASTRKTLENLSTFKSIRQDMLSILDAKDRIPGITKIGNYYYNFWTDSEHRRGIWRRTTLAEYRKADPKWDTIIDVDALGQADKQSYVWHGANCVYPNYDRCLVSLSVGGGDAVIVREFDLKNRTWVKNGFELPLAKGGMDWINRDTVFVQTDFGDGSMTTSSYPRIVKLWKRGTPLSSAKTVIAAEKDDMSANGFGVDTNGVHYDRINVQHSFYESDEYLFENNKLVKLNKPKDATISFFGHQLLMKLESPLVTSSKTWPAGSLLAIDLKDFRAGNDNFVALFTPSDTTSLEHYTFTRHYVILDVLDKVKGRLIEWKFDQGKWTNRQVDAPAFGSVSASAVDPDHSDDYFFSHTDFLTPSNLALASAGSDKRELLKQSPERFNASGLEIAQYEAKSKDGTLVPYFIVKPRDLKLDGNNPTLLYGYGGFKVSMTPGYNAGIGKAWLERGGVYVLANIRGGGEFGPRWHEGALKEKRQRAYDDFIAIGEDLIARKITSPRHLGIQGGSNGGLLMGVMLTQRPDLWNAVVCQVPLLDMKRYNKLLAGASWMGEYGNPDIPAEWEYISRFSPYQNVKAEVKYPNVLFTTSTRDDRVHPGHARKMAAKMMDQGHPNVLYYENIEGGHAGAADSGQRADKVAMEYAFLWDKLAREGAEGAAK